MLLAQLLPAQITPVTVSPEPLAGFNRSPEKMVQVGNRLVAIFGTFNAPLQYSDDNGATWTPTSVISGQLEDLIVNDNRLFLLLFISGNVDHKFIVLQSDDQGATFTQSYVAVDPTIYDNSGGILSQSISGRLANVNGHIFLTYKLENGNSANTNVYYFRGKYSDDNGTTWQSFNPDLENLPSAYKICYFKNRYVIVLDGRGPQMSTVAISSETPDFFDFTPLNIFGTSTPDLLQAAGVAADKLFVVSDFKKLYSISTSDGSESFVSSTFPFGIGSAEIINNHFYYFNSRGVLRADPADPLSPQVVFNGPFDGNAKGGGPHKVSTAGGMIVLAAGVPLKSTDDGQTWSLWNYQVSNNWAGPLITTDNQLFVNNGWAFMSSNGTQFDLWNSNGLPEPYYLPWSSIFSHKGKLFYAVTNENAFNSIKININRSTDQGQNWSVVDSRDNVYRSYLYASEQRLYWTTSTYSQGISHGQLKYSDDAGDTWNTVATEAPSIATGLVASGDSVYCLLYKYLAYSYDMGQTWDSTAITPDYYRIYYHNHKIVLCAKSTGVIYTSTDGGKSFTQTISLPNKAGADAVLIADSILVTHHKMSSTTYAGKIGSSKWISFTGLTDWYWIGSMAYFGGYLYGSRASYSIQPVNGGSTFSRIPFDQILDPLNNLPDNAGVVSGRLFVDPNNNCALNANEKTLSAQVVSIEPGGYATTTNPDGSFSIAMPPGNYTVSTDTPLYHLPACFGPNFNVAVNTAQNVAKNIAFSPNGTVQDLAVTVVSTRVRPGRNAYFTIEVTNHGTVASPAGVTMRFNFPENPMFYVSSFPAGASVSQGAVQFLLPSIPAYSAVKLKVTLEAVADAALTGQTLSFTAEVVDNFGDAFPADNLYVLPVLVTNSYDPNDKTAFTNAPKGDKITPADPSMKFLIRFQNTGTDTAFQVIIRDTLSSLLDAKTIKTLSASHDYRFVLRENNIAEWHFNPIELPDSTTNEQASHGFVLFSIDGKGRLPVGKSIDNRAGIFFDFNPAVMTNTTHTKVVRRIIFREDSAVAEEVAIRVLPNPATSYFNIEIDGAKDATHIFELFDATGKRMTVQSFSGARLQVQRNDLPAGIYHWVVRQKDIVTGAGKIVFE